MMRTRKNRNVLFLLILFSLIMLVLSRSSASDETYKFVWGYLCGSGKISMTKSSCDNLCWAACMQAVLKGANISVEQCSIQVAKNYLDGEGSIFCCEPGCPCECSGCDEYNYLGGHEGSVQEIFLSEYCISTDFYDTKLDTFNMMSSIAIGNPIIVALASSLHDVLVVGYGHFSDSPSVIQLVYLDPKYSGENSVKRDTYNNITNNIANDYLVCNIYTVVTSYNNPFARLVYFLPSIYSKGVKVKFATSFEDGTSRFVLQRFNKTEKRFEAIGTVESRGNEAEGAIYEVLDSAGSEDDVYRLIEVEEDGDRCILGLSKVYSKDPLAGLNLKKRERLCEISELRREREELLGRSAKGDRFLRVPPVANYNWVAIYPDSFEQDVSDLIFWRWLQGYSSGGKSIEEIRDEYGFWRWLQGYSSGGKSIEEIRDEYGGSRNTLGIYGIVRVRIWSMCYLLEMPVILREKIV